MENEKQNKQNKVKKVVFEVVYWVLLGLGLIFALCIGAHQSKTWDSIENRLSKIEEHFYKEENAHAIQNAPKMAHLRDSSVTDLTGTTWLFNDTINVSSIFEYNIDFESNDYDGYVKLKTNYDTYTSVYNLRYDYDEDWDTAYKSSNGWQDNAYKTIIISGGNDVTNSNLISWLGNNATQQGVEPEEPTEPTEHVKFDLPQRYDFRKWFGQVDPLTGCVKYTTTSSNLFHDYDIGSITISGNSYRYLHITTYAVTNAIHIITGYDFQNQCYLAMGGGDYYDSDSGYSLILSIWLDNTAQAGQGSGTYTNQLKLYDCPLVGARLTYESGNPLSPTSYVPAVGYLCSTFELNSTAINWEDYQPSDTKYNFTGLGDNLSVYEVLQLDLLNDTYLDFYTVSASATGGNIFDLIGNAFKVITNLASIQVIPGISLGLLVVLPITATIIIVVIRLVRK